MDETPDDIPELLPPDEMPPVTTADDLHRTWRALMGELGFSAPAIWLLIVSGDGRAVHLVQMAEVHEAPSVDQAETLADMCADLLSECPGSSVEVLLTRPGGPNLSRWDRLTAERLRGEFTSRGLTRFPLHRANDVRLAQITPDDLLGAVPAI